MNNDKESKDSLGTRMKKLEKSVGERLDLKMPAVIRVDGRAFSTYTRGFKKPFDTHISGAMSHAAKMLCEEVQNAKIAYAQSDEITILMTTHESEERQTWFDGRVQKIVSNAASIATEAFNEYMDANYWIPEKLKEPFDGTPPKNRKRARFDARVFNVPHDEINNILIWRQQDAIKNSKQMVAQQHFSHKELHGKNTDQQVEMLRSKFIIWDEFPLKLQRGFCIVKEQYQKDGATRSRWTEDSNVPLFVEDRNYVGRFAASIVIS